MPGDFRWNFYLNSLLSCLKTKSYGWSRSYWLCLQSVYSWFWVRAQLLHRLFMQFSKKSYWNCHIESYFCKGWPCFLISCNENRMNQFRCSVAILFDPGFIKIYTLHPESIFQAGGGDVLRCNKRVICWPQYKKICLYFLNAEITLQSNEKVGSTLMKEYHHIVDLGQSDTRSKPA